MNQAGMTTFKETRARSLIKGIVWRLFAFLNSTIVLICFGKPILASLTMALVMNITGLIVFYVYERVWNKIKKGRYVNN